MAEENLNKSTSTIGEFSYTITDGTSLNDGSSTTSIGSSLVDSLFYNQNLVKIESFNFLETHDGNFIEIVKRQAPNPYTTLAVWPPRANVDRVWKEIYGISRNENGKKELKLIKSIEGTVTPGHYVEEKIEFQE
jgi:hypothetical protein